MLIWLYGIAQAQIAPGTTVGWYGTAPFGPNSVANTSITGDGTSVWVAMEGLDSADGAEPWLNLLRSDTPWATFSMVQLQAIGELTNDGMYPSIVTWPGATQVWVTAKEDLLQAESHLRVYRQNRNDLLLPPGFDAPTATNTGFDHGRPHLTYDAVTDEHYMCWTRKNAVAEDVWSKPKDQPNWLASTDRAVSATGDLEDHCYQDFHVDGARYTAFHRDTVTDDIWLEVTTWNGVTWTTAAEFALTGSAGADFPSIDVRMSNIGGQSRVHVAAKSATANTLYWTCSGTRASCDSATDFGASASVLTGGDHWDPKVFEVPRGLFGRDVYIVYQKQTLPRKVKIASNCGGAGVWVEEGALPLPALSYNVFQHTELGANRSSADPSVHWDGTNIHVAFLARQDASAEIDPMGPDIFWQLDLMHYSVAPSALCP